MIISEKKIPLKRNGHLIYTEADKGNFLLKVYKVIVLLLQHWFLEKEQCRTNVLVWLGPRLGKMFFIAR